MKTPNLFLVLLALCSLLLAPCSWAASGDTLAGNLIVQKKLVLQGDIAPTSLSASQNDYSPTGLDTAAVLRLTSSVSCNITGLAGGEDGRRLTIYNDGATYTVTLVSQSSSSTAANRFLFTANVAIAPLTSVEIQYDSTASRWKQVGGSGSGGGGGGAWGTITGTLADQLDLDTALQNKQTKDTELTALAGLTSAADKVPYFTGSGTAALADFTSLARTFNANSTSAGMRSTIGLDQVANVDTTSATNITTGTLGPDRLAGGSALQVLRRNVTNNGLEFATISAGSGDLISTNNLSDVSNAATAFANIKQSGTTSTTGAVRFATNGEVAASAAVQGNDSRLSDARTPSDASVTAAKVAASLKPSGTAATTDEALRALGTAAGTAAAGNDSRITGAAQVGSANSFTAANDFALNPSTLISNLSSGTALTVGTSYYDSISADRTITVSGSPVNGSIIDVRWAVTSAPTLTFSGFTVKRAGQTNATVSTLALNPASAASVIIITRFRYNSADTTWYLTDNVGGTLAISGGGTGATTASGAFDALSVAETTVASASTTDLGAVASGHVSITGTTTITSFGTVAAGVERSGAFTGALTLTYNATSLILPGAANITTVAGDTFRAVSLGSGNWRVYSYTPISGKAVNGGRNYYVNGGSFNPTASTTYYFGAGNTPTSAGSGRNMVTIQKAGRITSASVVARTSGTDSASWTVGISVNNGTQVDIASVSTSASDIYWDNFALSIAVAQGDRVEIKQTTPAWGTARSNVVFSGNIGVE